MLTNGLILVVMTKEILCCIDFMEISSLFWATKMWLLRNSDVMLQLNNVLGVSEIYGQFSLEMRESLRNSPVSSFEIPSSIMCVDFLFLWRTNSGTTTNTTRITAMKPPINVFRKFQNILTVDSAQSLSVI